MDEETNAGALFFLSPSSFALWGVQAGIVVEDYSPVVICVVFFFIFMVCLGRGWDSMRRRYISVSWIRNTSRDHDADRKAEDQMLVSILLGYSRVTHVHHYYK